MLRHAPRGLSKDSILGIVRGWFKVNSVNSYLFGEFGHEKVVLGCCVTRRVAFQESSILEIKYFKADSVNCHFFSESEWSFKRALFSKLEGNVSKLIV